MSGIGGWANVEDLNQVLLERDRYKAALERIMDETSPASSVTPYLIDLHKIVVDALEPSPAVNDTARTVYGGPARKDTAAHG